MGNTPSSSAATTKEVIVNIAGEDPHPTTATATATATATTTTVVDDKTQKKTASFDSTDNAGSATTTPGLEDKHQQQQRMGVVGLHYLEFALWIVILLFIISNVRKCCGGGRHNDTNDKDGNKRRFGGKRRRLSEDDDFDNQLLRESLQRSAPSPRRAAPTTPRGGGGVTIDVTQNTIHEIPREGRQQPVSSMNSNNSGYRVINANKSSNFPPSSTNNTTPPPIISKLQARANAMVFAKRDKQRLEEARGTIHAGSNNSRDTTYTRTTPSTSTNNKAPVISKQQARENAKIFAKRDKQRLEEVRGTNNRTIPSSSMNSNISKLKQAARANALKFAKRDKKRLDDAKK